MPDRVGQQLGNYRLLRSLGRGGFAEVYQGEHIYLKRRAALKVLHTSLDDEDVERFLAEAQTLARLDHPHIVRVLEFFVEHGTPVLVMDLAGRGTLRQRHSPGTCLSLETTVSYVKQVASALQYAHNHQVIHRDVKPENMLLGFNQEVLLSDFGISLFSPSHEQLSTQEMAGTLPYMAPEQIRGWPTFASDQYALGIVVYEWLCGKCPFSGSYWQIIQQQLFTAPALLRQHDPSLPQAVEDVVLRALAKDAQQRYASVQLFAQALERASQGASLLLSHVEAEEITASLGPPSSPLQATSKPRRVFVSAAKADHDFVAQLGSDLQRHGLAVWDGDYSNSPSQEDAIRKAIRAIDVLLLVVSPQARTSESIAVYLRIAGMYQRRLVFVWVAGDDISAALPGEWGKTLQVDLIDARQRRYEEVLNEVIDCLQEESTATPQDETALVSPDFEPRNPYKGLRAFTGNDVDDFFGRDTLIEELVNKVKEVGRPGMSSARLLAVIGPSGSGKSSVVMAGLLPRLQKGVLPHSDEWVYLEPMVPGAQPIEALALTLAPHFPNRSLKTLREDLQNGSGRGLHRLASQLVQKPAQKIVLLVDQFEELFISTSSEEERERFINLLVTATSEPQGAVLVILTLRADFYDRPLSYPALGRLVVRNQSMVLPMGTHELREAIKRPAALPDVQLTFEGSLVADLLFEVQGQPGALPLLQFTLEQLFERRNGHRLTQQAYREIGGVKGALAKQAEATYASLPSDEHRRLARALFLRLIDPGLTEQDTTRRRAALSELALPTPEETEVQQQVVAYFLAARLLTTSEQAGVPTIEVSHEALIREWMRLAGWLREAREDIRLQQSLSEDVAQWQQHGKPRDRLYRGSQLKDARAWSSRNIASRDELAFLQASTVQRALIRLGTLALVLLFIVAAGGVTWQFLSTPNLTLVTSLSDNGPGSLRSDILLAPAGSTIKFAPGLQGEIMLTSQDLSIDKDLTIQGPGAGVLSIVGSNNSHNVKVKAGATVTISGLTFTGFTDSGIENQGTLTLINSIVSGNAALHNGGGIFNDYTGTLTLKNSTISGNRTAIDPSFLGNQTFGYGGGIFNHGALTLKNSTVVGNAAQRDGGGIYSGETVSGLNPQQNRATAMVTITNSTIAGNSAARNGGGIYNGTTAFTSSPYPVTATFKITGSAISRNTAGINGGGIYNSTATKINTAQATLSLTNSTIVGNRADSGSVGGIYNTPSGQLDLTFCTIYGNSP